MEFTWGMLQPFDEHVQAVKTVSRSRAGKANVVNEVSAAKAKAFSIVEFAMSVLLHLRKWGKGSDLTVKW